MVISLDRELVIRPATVADASSVADIYNHYVENTTVTFEETPVSPPEIARRIQDVGSASLPWLVAERDAEVFGYAYATRWHARAAYRFSAEITVYLHADRKGMGIGSKLYDQLLPTLQTRGIHAVVAVIALPNVASVALHERFGFSKAGHLEQVGFKFERWIDVGYWQRILEAVERDVG